MRGQILGVDLKSGDGQIAGDDGKRYRFRPEDWSDRAEPAVGVAVDFEASETRALSVYRIPGATEVGPVHSPRANERNKIVAALLAFFLGVFGIHRFYLGRTGSGIAMLVLTCTVIGLFVTGIWAFVDFVRYLIMSDDEFDRRYAYD